MKYFLLSLLCFLIMLSCGSEPAPGPRQTVSATQAREATAAVPAPGAEQTFPPPPDLTPRPGEETDVSQPEIAEQTFPPPPDLTPRPGEETGAGQPEIVEIQEKLFLSQTNDIYINPDEYQDKLIKLEGMWFAVKDEFDDSMHYLLVRYGPGCCGYDGVAGFEVLWEGTIPRDNDWVKGAGFLEKYWDRSREEEYLRLRLAELTVLPQRGQETVYR
jgi:hypothetical protein